MIAEAPRLRFARAILNYLGPVVIFAALVTIPITLAELNGQGGDAFVVADWAIWTAFALEVSLGLALANDRWAFLRKSWLLALIVVLSIPVLPAVLGFVRLARVARALRLVRLVGFSSQAFPALKATLGRRAVLFLMASFFLLVAVAGSLMSIVEPQTVKGNMWDGMWWAVVTSTTVGYGDISPVTPLGRAVAVALMVVGIGMAGTLAASVGAYFVNQGQKDEVGDVVTRLDRMERLLRELHTHQNGDVSQRDSPEGSKPTGRKTERESAGHQSGYSSGDE